MNHNAKLKNYNRSTAHRKSMFKNMIRSYEEFGHVKTTLAKAKRLKSLIQKDSDQKISIVRLENRKGDNALMVQVMGERHIKKLNEKKQSKKKSKSKAKTKAKAKPKSKK